MTSERAGTGIKYNHCTIIAWAKLDHCLLGRKRKRLLDDVGDGQPEVKKTKTETGSLVRSRAQRMSV